MADEVADGQQCVGVRVGQLEHREVLAHRVVPGERPVVHQRREQRGGELLGTRREREYGVLRHRTGGVVRALPVPL
jgi:hypothetical protein